MAVGVGSIVRVTARLRGNDGQDIMNVFQARHDGIVPIADTQAMDDLAQWLDDMYAEINAQMDATTVYVDVLGFNETSGNPLPATAWPTQTAGGNSGQGMPPGDCQLIRLNTGVSRAIGRKYLPPYTEADCAFGTFSNAAIAGAGLFASHMLSSFVGSASGSLWLPGIVDKTAAFLSFTEAVVSVFCAYQRRRRPGTGS